MYLRQDGLVAAYYFSTTMLAFIRAQFICIQSMGLCFGTPRGMNFSSMPAFLRAYLLHTPNCRLFCLHHGCGAIAEASQGSRDD